jgi:hypothetical protein
MIDDSSAPALGLRNQTPASAARDGVALRTRAHHRLRTFVSERPAIYLPFARRKYPGPSPEVIGSETQVVIDGFTRSASTFAVYAFQLAQERPVRMAHHLHAPAQLIAAARARLPTIAVIRQPKEAVLSQVVREPDVDLRDALWAYTRFYGCLLPLRPHFVVADFDEITTDFGAVIRRVNRKFGTSYREFESTPENVERCLALMRERSKLPRLLLAFESGTATLADALAALPPETAGVREEAQAWVPTERRHRDKAALYEQWSDRRLMAARQGATTVYEQFSALAGER